MWVRLNVHLFDVQYDGRQTEFQVHPEYGSRAAAREQVDACAAVLGRLPRVMLSNAKEVEISITAKTSSTTSLDPGEPVVQASQSGVFHICTGRAEEVARAGASARGDAPAGGTAMDGPSTTSILKLHHDPKDFTLRRVPLTLKSPEPGARSRCCVLVAAVASVLLLPLTSSGSANAQSTGTEASSITAAANTAATAPGRAARPQDPAAQPEATGEQRSGSPLPTDERLRISVGFLAAYGFDAANADKGYETQGRIGQASVALQGKFNNRFEYLISMGAIDEISPLPACPERGFFYPNDPKFAYAELYAQGRGPQIDCDPQGTRRVDLYRGIALDMLPQQGALREGYLKVNLWQNGFLQFGRVAQPIGFTPEEAGSWTARDAALIQRLNRDAFFMLRIGLARRIGGVEFGGSAAAISGDSDASKDYGYNKLFNDGSLDGNSGPGAIVETYARTDSFDVRLGYRHNEMGSKIESLAPSYFASGKHHDKALVLSGQYRVNRRIRVLAECAHYTVGLKESSALLVGVNPAQVFKNGCYFTAEGRVPVRPGVEIGGSFTREEIDRADSLIRFLSEKGLYQVVEGNSDRMSVFRIFADLSRQVRVGAYYNRVINPYPWVSGIYPVEGPRAFTGRSLNRWGLVVQFALDYRSDGLRVDDSRHADEDEARAPAPPVAWASDRDSRRGSDAR